MTEGLVVADRYRIEELLGSGAYGSVHAGLDLRLGRRVALKILRDGHDRDRFLREAQAVARLDHPGIVAAFDAVSDPVGDVIVLERVEGETLDAVLDRGPLRWDRATRLVADVAAALAHAHARGVVHRDIKPANILLARGPEGLHPKITDFGIARVMDFSTLTPTGEAPGTLAWMSPEILSGNAAGAASDVWAVGVLLYQSLTGVLPFRAGNAGALIDAIRQADPAAPRSLRKDVPDALEAVVLHCLRKDPAARPPSMAHLERQLRALVAAPSARADLAPPAQLALSSIPAPEDGARRRVVLVLLQERHLEAAATRFDASAVAGHRRAVLDTVFEACDRFGGRVAEISEDGAILVFGLPAASDIDAESAVACAEELVRRLHGTEVGGISVELAAAIHAGRLHSAPGEKEWRVRGEARRLVERLCDETPNGEIRASGGVVDQSRRREQFEPCGEISLGVGKRSTGSFRVSGQRSVPEKPAIEMIGREHELSLLMDAVEGVERGHGLVVTLTGASGIGKTRLVHEALARIAELHPAWRAVVVEARDVGSRGTYQLFRDLWDRLGRLPSTLRDDATARALGQAERDVLAAQVGGEWDGEAVRHLGDEERRTALRLAWLRLLGDIAAQAPLVILVEDLHWLDDASRELLFRIAESVAGMPLVFVLTGRPEVVVPWQGRTFHRPLVIGPLAPRHEDDLLTRALGGAELTDRIRAGVRARTEGNPLFVLEVGRALRDRRDPVTTGTIEIPPSIEAILAARLDRLSVPDRRLVQVAAIIGRVASADLIAATLGASLEDVLEAGQRLAVEDLLEPYPASPDVAFAFHHALVQEVAYDTLAPTARAALHGQVAAAIVSRGQDAPESIGRHFARSAEPARAVPHLRLAARRARMAGDLQGARAQAEEALRIVQDSAGAGGAEEIDVRLQIAEILAWIGPAEEGLAHARAALAMAPEDDARTRLRCHLAAAEVLGHGHRQAEALEELEVAERLAVSSEDVSRQADILARRVGALLPLGRLQEAERALATLDGMPNQGASERLRFLQLRAQASHAVGASGAALDAIEEGLRLCSAAGDAARRLNLLAHRCTVLHALGDPHAVVPALDEAIDEARHLGVAETEAYLLAVRAGAEQDRLELEDAEGAARKALALATAVGHEIRMLAAEWTLGRIVADRGRPAEAREFVSSALARARAVAPTWELTCTVDLAAIELTLGRADLASATAAEALVAARERRNPFADCDSLAVLVNALRVGGRAPEARDLAIDLVAAARNAGEAGTSGPGLVAASRACLAVGAREDALGLASEALAMAAGLRRTRDEAFARHAWAEALLESGRVMEAATACRAVLAALDGEMPELRWEAWALLGRATAAAGGDAHPMLHGALAALDDLARGLDAGAVEGLLGREDRAALRRLAQGGRVRGNPPG